jgi:hypothetical protein
VSYYDETLTPAAGKGVYCGLGETPYPFNDIADVEPKAGLGSASGLGDSPFGASWDTQPLMVTEKHTGEMDEHHGPGIISPSKPGSFK